MQLTKQITITSKIKVFYLFLNKTKFIVLQNSENFKRFLVLPKGIVLKKLKNNLIVATTDQSNKGILISFFNSLYSEYSTINSYYSKKLLLKGLGFRVQLQMEKDKIFLVLKLGFSHLVKLEVPTNNIAINIKRNTIILKSFDKTLVGNFASLVKNFRRPNVYSGKGFWYFREKISLKAIKKI